MTKSSLAKGCFFMPWAHIEDTKKENKNMKKYLLYYNNTKAEFESTQYDSEKEAYDNMKQSYEETREALTDVDDDSSYLDDTSTQFCTETSTELWHIEEIDVGGNEERLKALLYNAVCYMSEQRMSMVMIENYLGTTEEELRSFDALYEGEEKA